MFSRTSKSSVLMALLIGASLIVPQSNAAQPVVPNCNLESISGANTASKPIILYSKNTRSIMFSGWVAQTGGKTPNPTSVSVGIFSSDGKKLFAEFNSTKLTPRPDVKKFFKNLAIGNVGFNAKSSSVIQPGKYSAWIMSKYGKSDAALACGGWQITVK